MKEVETQLGGERFIAVLVDATDIIKVDAKQRSAELLNRHKRHWRLAPRQKLGMLREAEEVVTPDSDEPKGPD